MFGKSTFSSSKPSHSDQAPNSTSIINLDSDNEDVESVSVIPQATSEPQTKEKQQKEIQN